MQGVIKFVKGIGMVIVMSLYAGLIYQALMTMVARYKARRAQV